MTPKSKKRTRLINLKVILLVLGSLLLLNNSECPLFYSAFKIVSINPENNSSEIPVNAVIKVIFRSKAAILEESLVAENFTLVKLVKDPKKPVTTNEDGTKTEGEIKTIQREAVRGIIRTSDKDVKEQTKNGTENWVETTLFYIPFPDKDASRPLERAAEYVFKINELEDEDGNIFAQKETHFTTSKKDRFVFSTDPTLRLVSPQGGRNLLEKPIAEDEMIVMELSKPVNPFKIMNNSKLTSDMDRDISLLENTDEKTQAKLEELEKRKPKPKTVDELLSEAEKYLAEYKKLGCDSDELETSCPDEEEAIKKLEAELEETVKEIDNELNNPEGTLEQATKLEMKEKRILKEISDKESSCSSQETKCNEIANKVDKIEAQIAKGDVSQDGSLNEFRNDTEESHDFAVYFIEELKPYKKDKNSKERFVLDYKKIAFTAEFSQRYLYKLTVKASSKKGSEDIATITGIHVDLNTKSSDSSEIKANAINFLGDEKE